MRNQIFISYSHKDDLWRQRLIVHLAPWVRKRTFTSWDDHSIAPGNKWRDEIAQALDKSNIAILLVTPNFLASEFINNDELAPILSAAEKRGLVVVWIYVSSCAYKATLLKDYQAANDTVRPLDLLDGEGQINAELSRIAEQLASRFLNEDPVDEPAVPVPQPSDSLSDTRVVILYKRQCQPDEQVVEVIRGMLQRESISVFIDKDIEIGIDWAKTITGKIRNADAVIPLLSEQSVQSEMLAYELQLAYDCSKATRGFPRILPVRVAFDGRLREPLGTILNSLQYFLWRGPEDNPCLVKVLRNALHGPLFVPPSSIPAAGGGMSTTSEFYIRREQDQDFQSAIFRQDSIILLKGSRQVGKTSMLGRGLQAAREKGALVVTTNFEKLARQELTTLDSLFFTLASWISDSLGLPAELAWKPQRSPQTNFEAFIQEILIEKKKHLVWAMDEVDLLFGREYASEFFASIRSWHNDRSLDPEIPWGNLTIVLAYATEASLFITNLNQSPFNVGTRLTLSDFTRDQLQLLHSKYRDPIQDPDSLEAFYNLTGGHPYLASRGFEMITSRPTPVAEFLANADLDNGPYGDHLKRYIMLLSQDPQLLSSFRNFLSGGVLEPQNFVRLRAGGLLSGNAPAEAKIRCALYQRYFSRHFKG